ncbi:unnamed protein product [Wuchereria bancrofti]|uniref:ZP domain-containing protein n=1 Tax=Wuchereria bancrofti TaxID=6293 RepID=A0A3P7E5T0_WUCBA|nr:unnamed protein product [Wuchereria bancrofti]
MQKEPSGITYQVIIIVQYHYLFLTQAYKAYSVSCFYETVFDPNMEISGLTMTELESEIMTNCAYDVINSINGESVKYANIGDRLIHKWSCESEEYGMLIHSCFAYESDSAIFQLIDNQGCITDHTLMDPLNYSDSLTVAYSMVPAFKFVDKLTIRFQCKVTLCIKAQNGCKGISPPKCEIISTLTSISKLSTSKFPTPIRSKILQSLLPRNIELLCDESTELESCKNILNASKRNFSTSYRRKRFLNESGLAMNPILRKSFTETNYTNVTRFTLDIHANQVTKFSYRTKSFYWLNDNLKYFQLAIFERNEINRIKSPEVPSISFELLRNKILLQIAIFVLFMGFILTIIFMKILCYSKCITVISFEKYAQQWQI